MMHNVYLPFSKKQLLNHFAEVKQNGVCIKNKKHLNYYINSIENYNNYCDHHPNSKGRPITKMRTPRQIEKDERFWTVACMMTIFYSPNRKQEFIDLFTQAYGTTPQ